MKIMSGKRYGKSCGLIMAASQKGAVVFCATKESEKRLLEQAKVLGVTINTMVKK